MSVYLKEGKGWRYDFTLKKIRYTNAWYRTKREAKLAMERRKEEIRNPPPQKMVPTDMDFLEMANKRLDYVIAYNAKSHYDCTKSVAKGWSREWGHLKCSEISSDMVQNYMLRRSRVSAFTANRDLRYLRSLFNFGIEKNMISDDPTKNIRFLPVERKLRHVPSQEDILRVIHAAEPDDQSYLWVFRETLGRMSEINRLTWDDVNFEEKFVTLRTRKKKGGNLTPRKIPMNSRLIAVLSRLFKDRDKTKPWIFWHRYWDRKKKMWIEGPYKDRSKLMRILCEKAGVEYFRYHGFRHSGASYLEHNNKKIGSIQRILGHESRVTTEIYLHSVGEDEREAMKVFDQLAEYSHTDSHIKEKDLESGFSKSLN